MAREAVVRVVFKGVDQVSGALRGIGGNLGRMTTIVAGAASAMSGIAASAMLVGREYATSQIEVANFAAAMGLGVEEMSRMQAVAGDVGVSTAELERAFRMMIQRGVQPTIGNLADLSAQYLAIEDPTQRAAFAQERFGLAWLQMVPLLEMGPEQLREMYAAVDEGIVVTEEAVEASQAFLAAQNGLNDAWLAAKNEIMPGFLRALTGVVTWINEHALPAFRALASFVSLQQGIAQGRVAAGAVDPRTGMAIGNTPERVAGGFGAPIKRQFGGIVPSGPFLAGERGAELVSGGRVYSSRETKEILGGATVVAEMRGIRDEIRTLIRNLPTQLRDAMA